VTPLPIASFLAGSLLTILLPLGVLIAICVWSLRFLRRAPDPGLVTSSTADPLSDVAVALPEPTRPDEEARGGSPPVG
jgi:hypothetical protein